jgi:hypothetical protein
LVRRAEEHGETTRAKRNKVQIEDREGIEQSGKHEAPQKQTAQQAVSLAASLCPQRGDTVLSENPPCVGAIDAFRAVGRKLAPARIEGARLRVERLPARVRANAP